MKKTIKKNILKTSLLILSFTMIACGQQRALNADGTEISIPETPGVALNSTGQLSSVCSNSSCSFNSYTTVVNPEYFLALNNGQIFSEPSQGTFFDLGESISGIFNDGLDHIKDNCGIAIGISLGGDRSVGVDCDFNNNSRTQLGHGYQSTLAIRGNSIQNVLSIQTAEGVKQIGFAGTDLDNSGVYVNLQTRIQIIPIGIRNNTASTFVIQDISGNFPIEVARIDIQGNR